MHRIRREYFNIITQTRTRTDKELIKTGSINTQRKHNDRLLNVIDYKGDELGSNIG